MRLDLEIDLEALGRRVARGSTLTALRDVATELIELCASYRDERNQWMTLCHEADVRGSLSDEACKLAERRAENCKTILIGQEQVIRELSHKLGHVRDAANLVADSLKARTRVHGCAGLDCRVCCPRQLIEELRCAVRDSQ